MTSLNRRDLTLMIWWWASLAFLPWRSVTIGTTLWRWLIARRALLQLYTTLLCLSSLTSCFSIYSLPCFYRNLRRKKRMKTIKTNKIKNQTINMSNTHDVWRKNANPVLICSSAVKSMKKNTTTQILVQKTLLLEISSTKVLILVPSWEMTKPKTASLKKNRVIAACLKATLASK